MKQSEIKRLLEKFHSGDPMSEAETEKLKDWYNSFEGEKEMDPAGLEGSKNRMWESIRSSTSAKVVSLSGRRQKWKYAIAAASVILLAGLSVWWMQVHPDNQHVEQVTAVKTKAQDIQPGGNKATLTLADGSVIFLDQVQNGVVASDQHTKVIKEEGGKLAYQPSENTAGRSVKFNTITTPPGGQYQVVLADGSKVWLNSMSSLKFPMEFDGKDRTVELKGEGYFEVAHNAEKPFYVKTENISVLALGTEFNVRSYGGDDAILTTLVQGSIRVATQSQERILKPYDQVIYKKSEARLEKPERVDLDEIVAWKNGYFLFRNRKLATILNDLEKWYNATIVYKADIPDSYSLRISRDVPVSKLLKFIELSGGVHFKIENQQIIVNK